MNVPLISVNVLESIGPEKQKKRTLSNNGAFIQNGVQLLVLLLRFQATFKNILAQHCVKGGILFFFASEKFIDFHHHWRAGFKQKDSFFRAVKRRSYDSGLSFLRTRLLPMLGCCLVRLPSGRILYRVLWKSIRWSTFLLCFWMFCSFLCCCCTALDVGFLELVKKQHQEGTHRGMKWVLKESGILWNDVDFFSRNRIPCGGGTDDGWKSVGIVD